MCVRVLLSRDANIASPVKRRENMICSVKILFSTESVNMIRKLCCKGTIIFVFDLEIFYFHEKNGKKTSNINLFCISIYFYVFMMIRDLIFLYIYSRNIHTNPLKFISYDYWIS